MCYEMRYRNVKTKYSIQSYPSIYKYTFYVCNNGVIVINVDFLLK